MSDARPLLFSDHGCPFAHRVLALLDHLGIAFDRRESAVGEKPDGLADYSRMGRIPLLVHGELAITESRVILEHLAEHYGFSAAYPEDLPTRTLHRHAMAVVDDLLVPLLATNVVPDSARLADVSRALEVATTGVAPGPCLLTFHVAPLWLRFRWWKPQGVVTRTLEAHPHLSSWLDAAASLDSVARTAPDRAEHVAAFVSARAAGLIS